jgi:hypothetical protein
LVRSGSVICLRDTAACPAACWSPPQDDVEVCSTPPADDRHGEFDDVELIETSSKELSPAVAGPTDPSGPTMVGVGFGVEAAFCCAPAAAADDEVVGWWPPDGVEAAAAAPALLARRSGNNAGLVLPFASSAAMEPA